MKTGLTACESATRPLADQWKLNQNRLLFSAFADEISVINIFRVRIDKSASKVGTNSAKVFARRMVGRVALSGIAVLLTIDPAAATPLITAQEAQLPADNLQLRSGIERGVDVVPVYPTQKSGAIQSPFNFRVRFRAHGNTEIDLDSLIIVYKKIPAIDLTERVRPFVKPDGINMPNAEVPPGAHRILIFLRDSAGHSGGADIRFDVEK